MRDYGLVTGVTNDKQWMKKEIHVMEGNTQCRLTLWNRHVCIRILNKKETFR